MSEFQPDLSNPIRCVSVHWSLPTQCEREKRHFDNWHWAKHPDTGSVIRYRYGAYVTEEVHDGEWRPLPIPAPVRRDVPALLGAVERLTLERDQARRIAVSLEQENARQNELLESATASVVAYSERQDYLAARCEQMERDHAETVAEVEKLRTELAETQRSKNEVGSWLDQTIESRRKERERLSKATRFEVSCLPEGHDARRYFRLTVEIQDRYGWTVHDGFSCLDATGAKADGLSVYERSDEWISAHRFDLDTALLLAEEHAPKLTVNGMTAADVLARDATRGRQP